MVGIILTAAARILVKSGYDASTTNRIAELAGVSIGSLYQYFPNKEALIAALIENQLEESRRKMEKAMMEAAARPTPQMIDAIIETLVDHFLKKRMLLRAIFAHAPELGKTQNILAQRNHFGGVIRQLLETRETALPREYWDEGSYVLVHAVMGAMQAALHDTSRSVSAEGLTRELSRMVKGYLL